MVPAGFTWADASLHSSLSESTLRRWARRGVLKVVKVGGRVVVLRDSLEALMRGESTAPPAVTAKSAGCNRGKGSVAASREPNHSVLLRGRRR